MVKKDVARVEAKRKFDRLFPMLRWILSEVQVTDQLNEFEDYGYKFLARATNGLVEFGAANERPIFPTIVYELSENGKPSLLTFRCGDELYRDLHTANAGSKDEYYLQMTEDLKDE